MEATHFVDVDGKSGKRSFESIEDQVGEAKVSPESKKIKIDPVTIHFSIDSVAASASMYSTSSIIPEPDMLDVNCNNNGKKIDLDENLKKLINVGKEKSETGSETQEKEALANNNQSVDLFNFGIEIDWTEDELLSLESAIPSYKYLPRTTLQKILGDINNRRKNHKKITKSSLESWFKVASDHYDHNLRLQTIFNKIEIGNSMKPSESDDKSEMSGNAKKIQFNEKYAYRKFYIDAPPQLMTKESFKSVKGAFSFQWSKEQLEVLDTAIDAFKYNPKVVAKKVHKEVRAMKTESCSKLQVVKWLENAVDHQSEQISERIENSIKDKLKEVNVEDNYVMKSRSPKLTFASTVDVRQFDKYLPASDVSEPIDS